MTGRDPETSAPAGRGATHRECRGVPPIMKFAAQPHFNRRIQPTNEEFAVNKANQDANRLRQPNVLQFLAGWKRYQEILRSPVPIFRLSLLLLARLQRTVFSIGRLYWPSYPQERNQETREGCNVRQNIEI